VAVTSARDTSALPDQGHEFSVADIVQLGDVGLAVSSHQFKLAALVQTNLHFDNPAAFKSF
jgi:hypothetical protein